MVCITTSTTVNSESTLRPSYVAPANLTTMLPAAISLLLPALLLPGAGTRAPLRQAGRRPHRLSRPPAMAALEVDVEQSYCVRWYGKLYCDTDYRTVWSMDGA